MPGAIRKAEELAAEIPNSFIPQQFENKANPDIHRVTTAVEILDQMDRNLDVFVATAGTGGTITGTGEALKEASAGVKGCRCRASRLTSSFRRKAWSS